MILFFLLQASGGFAYGQIVMMLLVFAVFYFFMIRPQQKKAKDAKAYQESLKKGDTVVTLGGLHGRIYSIQPETVTIEVDRAVKLTFDKAAISMESSKRAAKTSQEATPE